MRKTKYIIAHYSSDLPKVRKNEVLIVPEDNRLWENPPVVNWKKESKPTWWRNLKKDRGSLGTCYGTQDFLSLGFTLPMWTNVKVRPSANGLDFEIRADPLTGAEGLLDRIEAFPASSTPGCPFAESRPINGSFPKLVTPWQIKTAPGYSTLILPRWFEPNPNYSVMPGVVHTDYYHTINIVLSIHTDKEFTIPIGTPMYQLIPFKRDDNTKAIIEGNETMHRFLIGRGTGDMYLSNHDRRVAYRKGEREADALAEELSKKPFWRKK